MNGLRNIRLLMIAVCVSVSVTCTAQTQTQTTEPAKPKTAPPATDQYQPQVGQEGKDVVWVPTPDAMVDKMLELANVTPNDVLIDLGSGDGRTVIGAARLGARALGVEFNPEMVKLSQRNAQRAKVSDKATFRQGDLYEADLSQATVITLFLLPQINLKLRPKLLDLRPGTRIVSNTFTMGDWKADETEQVENDCTSYCTALLWIVPAKVEGTWKLANGQLTLKQSFQYVTGSITLDGKPTSITDGHLRGSTISFKVGDAEYTGTVAAAAMEGKVSTGGTWRATR
jgi:hypothetical protein